MPFGSKNNVRMPSTSDGSASSRKSHCQFDKPWTPLNACMIQPESGPPTTPATGMPIMKSAFMRPRRVPGYQYVRYSTMPGKNPASATPSRKRSV